MAKGARGGAREGAGAPRQHDRGALTKAICERLAQGEPMTVICRDLGVPVKTVNDWRLADAEIRAQFDEARDLGHDAIAVRMRLTARGKGPKHGGDSTGDVQRDKLIIDTDDKLLRKWDPRRYGEKVQLGNDPDNPLPAPQFIIQPVRPVGGGASVVPASAEDSE